MNKLIYIEWCDATSFDDVWKTKDESIEWAENSSWIVCNVGWLVKETPKYILLASKKCRDEDYIGGLIKIPKTWIVKRKVVS